MIKADAVPTTFKHGPPETKKQKCETNIGATSQDTQDKTHHKIISLLDFQKKMLGSAGPQVFIFG